MSSRGGELGFRKIRVKKTITFIFVLMRVEKVQILAVIYARRDQVKQLEQL